MDRTGMGLDRQDMDGHDMDWKRMDMIWTGNGWT